MELHVSFVRIHPVSIRIHCNLFLSFPCRKEEGKTAIDLAAGKPQVLKVLTNPPKPHHETDHTAGTQSGGSSQQIIEDMGCKLQVRK